MTPTFAVFIGGVNVTGSMSSRLLELSVVDSEGTQSDSCTVVLDDRDAATPLPSKGDVFTVHMGYLETGLKMMGIFTVDEIETNGFPRSVTIQARAADMGSAIKQTRNAGYDNKTISEIINEMAKRHGLQAVVSPSVGSFKYAYLAQSGESDMALGTRLAERHDALFKIAGGKMLFHKRGEAIGDIVVIVGDLAGGGQVKAYSAKAKERPNHQKATSSYWDRAKAEEVRKEAKSAQGSAEHLLKHQQPTPEEADAVANSNAQSLSRACGSVNITIVGDPSISAEMLMQVIGVRPGSADGLWRIKTATHTLNNNGYQTEIEGEASGKSSGGGG